MRHEKQTRSLARRGRTGLRTGWRIFVWGVALGVAALALYSVVLIGKIGPGGGIKNVINILDTIKDPIGKFDGKTRVHILLVGKDYNRDGRGILYTKNARADTIVLLSLDLISRKATALSIPRDSWITAPDGESGKINGTYSRGGAPLLAQTITQLLGVAPDYVVALKPDAVKNLVNELGGVDVETIDEMHRDDYWGGLHVHLPKGAQRITGEQAVGFARYREPTLVLWRDGKPVYDRYGNPIPLPASKVHHSKEDGDTRRMARQQQLIRAMIAEAKKPANLLRADKIVDTALGKQVLETSMTFEQFLALGALYRHIQPDQIQTGTLPGTDSRVGRVYAFRIDDEKKRHMVDWLVHGDEAAANRLTVVAVKNGTKVPGAAKRAAELLREQGGFDADSAGNAYPGGKSDGEVPATRIVYAKASVAPRAQRVADLLGGGQLVKEAAPDTTGVQHAALQRPDVTVVLGNDLAATKFSPRSARR